MSSYFGSRLPLRRRPVITVIGPIGDNDTPNYPNPSDFCPHCGIHYSRWKGEESTIIMFCGKCLHNLPQKYQEELEAKMKNKNKKKK